LIGDTSRSKGRGHAVEEINDLMNANERESITIHIVNGVSTEESIHTLNWKIRQCIVKLSPSEVEKISEELQKEEGIYG